MFGDYVCLESATGKELWRKNALTDLGGKKGPFGFCDYPLVDGDRLIVTPGGERAAVAALDRRTGAVAWEWNQTALASAGGRSGPAQPAFAGQPRPIDTNRSVHLLGGLRRVLLGSGNE
jgi:outer membrane protein assembly factor BamB